jgi:hypothetical protein
MANGIEFAALLWKSPQAIDAAAPSALAAAGRCRLESDKNDMARSSAEACTAVEFPQFPQLSQPGFPIFDRAALWSREIKPSTRWAVGAFGQLR